MEKLTFKTAVKIRKLIREEASRINWEAAKQNFQLTEKELLQVSKWCQDSIIPGMPTSEIMSTLKKEIEDGIKTIRSSRISSSILDDSQSHQQNQADLAEPKS
jgi:hypothetical protein